MGQEQSQGRKGGKAAKALDEAYKATALGERVLIVSPHLKITLHGPAIAHDLPVQRAIEQGKGAKALGVKLEDMTAEDWAEVDALGDGVEAPAPAVTGQRWHLIGVGPEPEEPNEWGQQAAVNGPPVPYGCGFDVVPAEQLQVAVEALRHIAESADHPSLTVRTTGYLGKTARAALTALGESQEEM